MKRTLIPLLACALLWSCKKTSPTETVEGYRPVYFSEDASKVISSGAPQPFQNPGKIYMKDSMLFINDKGKGIHIINNINPAQPQPLAFITIPGNFDMAVTGNYLYADNGTNLVVLDISNPMQATVSTVLPGIHPVKPYPEETDVVFECYDSTKGILTGWEKAQLTNPLCRR